MRQVGSPMGHPAVSRLPPRRKALTNRGRVGRVIQRLYGVGLILDTGRTPAGPSLAEAGDRSDESIADLRRIIAGHGAADDGLDRYDALVRLVDRATAQAAFEPDLRLSGLDAVVTETAMSDLLLVLEETLSSVVRRAERRGGALCLARLSPGTRVTWSVPRSGLTGVGRRRARAAVAQQPSSPGSGGSATFELRRTVDFPPLPAADG